MIQVLVNIVSLMEFCQGMQWNSINVAFKFCINQRFLLIVVMHLFSTVTSFFK